MQPVLDSNRSTQEAVGELISQWLLNMMVPIIVAVSPWHAI